MQETLEEEMATHFNILAWEEDFFFLRNILG